MSYKPDTADATCRIRVQTTGTQLKSSICIMLVCADCSFVICQQSRTHPQLKISAFGQVHTHTGKHTAPQRHTEHEAFCCWCEKLDCLSLFPLCLCALRYFPLSQFYELLCCSQKHERDKDLEDENQKRDGGWSEILCNENYLCQKERTWRWTQMKGRWRADVVSRIVCLDLLAGLFESFWTHHLPSPSVPNINTHIDTHICTHVRMHMHTTSART